MSSSHTPIKLFETVTDQCPYLPDQQSASILIDPEHKVEPHFFGTLSQSGFRRSGNMVYKPKCPSCNACVSVRIPAFDFQASRNQKRVMRKNNAISMKVEDSGFKQLHFDLYLKYQRARHPESSMCDDDPKKYISFIESYFSSSKFLCFYDADQLVGVSVIDQFQDGISAVYTFFDPDYHSHSLGTFAILAMIELAKNNNIPYVYLGYWISSSSKMNYKRQFRPLEGYIEREWITLDL